MDERLEKALAFGKYRMTVENRRRALLRRFESMTVVHFNNGMFQADQQTIAFVDALINDNHEDAVVLDVKQNPIEINNLGELRNKLMNAYFTATNEYLSEMKKLKKAKDVKKAMDW